MQCVDQAINLATPNTSQHKNSERKSVSNQKTFIPAPWWNKECDKVVQDRKDAASKFRKQSNYENYEQYKKCEVIAKRTFIKARKESFYEFCNNLNRTTPISRV